MACEEAPVRAAAPGLDIFGAADWLWQLAAEFLGCPCGCVGSAFSHASQLGFQACSDLHGRIAHSVYGCRRSRRRISHPLPPGCHLEVPAAGVAPAAFAAAWRRRSRELDTVALAAGGAAGASSPPRGPVRCPNPGCDHEEPDAARAARHAVACAAVPGNMYRGFCYAAPELLIAAWHKCFTTAHVGALLDQDLGGDKQQLLMSTCRIDRAGPALVVCSDEQHGLTKRMVHKFPIDGSVRVQRGSSLDSSARQSCLRGAFPRELVKVCLLGTIHRLDDDDRWFEDGYTLLEGHTWSEPLAPPVTDEAWGRTLVIEMSSAHGGPKARRREELLREHARGTYGALRLFLPSLLDTSCPATEEAWRGELARVLEEHRGRLGAKKRQFIASVLEEPLPRVTCRVSRQDVEEEYMRCATTFLFLTFHSQQAADEFANTLDGLARAQA